MFPDSSGLSDDSQSGASHLWPTMVPPRYSPPHSHPDDKPPPYSPWLGRLAGWERPTVPRSAASQPSQEDFEEEERWRGGRGGAWEGEGPPSKHAQLAWNRRASVYLSRHPSHSCLYLVWRCECERAWVCTREARPDSAHNQDCLLMDLLP